MTHDSPVLRGRAACAGDFCAPESAELQHGAVLFKQVGRDAENLRAHLSDISDRSKLFGPDIQRFERVLAGFERVRREGLDRLDSGDHAAAWARLNALILTLPVLTIQLQYVVVASHAEDAGVVSSHWLEMLRSMRSRTEPLLEAMVGFDLRRMEVAALAHRQGLADLQRELPEIRASMLRGARWTENALFWANGIMAAAAAYEMAVAVRGMGLGGGPGATIGLKFPALAGVGASGGVVVLSVEVLESLRELRRIGALSDVVVATVVAMTGKPELPAGQPVAAMVPSRTYPSRPPDPKARPRGEPEMVRPQESPENNLAVVRQNESAIKLARAGFDVEQLSRSNKQRSPDFRIEGQVFDNYAPTTSKPSNIWDAINDRKVNPDGKPPQTRRIILNLADSLVDTSDLRTYFLRRPMPNLDEVIAITKDGIIIHLWP